PMILILSLRPSEVTASSAPSAMSSLAATMTLGGVLRPPRMLSVTDRPLSRANSAVCSAPNLYLSAPLSRTLWTPLLRAIAGLALQVDEGGAVGEQLNDILALGLAAEHVVGADMGKNAGNAIDPPVDGHHRNPGIDRRLERRRHRVDLLRADHDAAHLLD